MFLANITYSNYSKSHFGSALILNNLGNPDLKCKRTDVDRLLATRAVTCSWGGGGRGAGKARGDIVLGYFRLLLCCWR